MKNRRKVIASLMLSTLLLAMPLQASAASTLYEKEPNDLQANSTSVNTGVIGEGAIVSAQDADWWKVVPTTGSLSFVYATIQTVTVTGAQFEVYDYYGNKLAGPMSGTYNTSSKYGTDIYVKVINPAGPSNYQVNSTIFQIRRIG